MPFPSAISFAYAARIVPASSCEMKSKDVSSNPLSKHHFVKWVVRLSKVFALRSRAVPLSLASIRAIVGEIAARREDGKEADAGGTELLCLLPGAMGTEADGIVHPRPCLEPPVCVRMR